MKPNNSRLLPPNPRDQHHHHSSSSSSGSRVPTRAAAHSHHHSNSPPPPLPPPTLQQYHEDYAVEQSSSHSQSSPTASVSSSTVYSTGAYSVSSTVRHATPNFLMAAPSSGASGNTTTANATTSAQAVTVVSPTSFQQQQKQIQLQKQQQQQNNPQPVLVKDAQHTPKTTGSLGLLVVGLGGANGTTLLAGLLANRRRINWRGPQGQECSPNYYGCLTQLPSCLSNTNNNNNNNDTAGGFVGLGGVGYKDRVRGLADANMAAIGGWDIRPTRPGDALLQAQILDYDLVRQVRDEMNKVKLFRGVYDPRFIGSSQHDTATHILTDAEAPTDSEKLKCLRADIRYFKWRNGLVGHTSVIWSASVEPNCELLEELETADDLLDAIEQSEEERGGPLPPSLLYATAALLEGCSFLNGGSQNTLSCPGLADLAKQQTGVYLLGTDFKAGQTKFKTAAVEYLRTAGLVPRVIASSNHLGNNDMRNLASSASTSTAKLRVKHDIFAPWQQQMTMMMDDDETTAETTLDHKVSIMYTPFINDDKRDFVEYTSQGFLGQVHTMVTYTRASDSVLCVPLMLDGAVWCDYFASRSWPYDRVARALAYLFKIPEGAAKGVVDPGFFRQMQELEREVLAAHQKSRHCNTCNGTTTTTTTTTTNNNTSSSTKRVRIRPDEKITEWSIPMDARIVCAGLACVDMQLNRATGGGGGDGGGGGGEGIETFEGEKSIGGGSVSMACKTLARLCHGKPLDEDYMQVTPPVVQAVVPLCKIGNDSMGDKLIALLEECGTACRNVETKYVKTARAKGDPKARTALAVLPIYQDGRRGCFFDAASNVTFSAREMVGMIASLSSGSSGPRLDTSHLSADDIENYQADLEQMTPISGAFLFGYPHLLPQMQGEALAQIFLEARSSMIEGGIIAMDMNGVPEADFDMHGDLRSVASLKCDPVIGAALEHVDILHLNEDELVLLTGCELAGTEESELEDDYAIAGAVNLFLMCGVAIVAVTRGSKGCYISCNDVARFRRSSMLPSSWVECTAKVGSVELPETTTINSNGAGDAFTSGLLVASMLRHTGMTVKLSEETTAAKQSAGSASPIDSVEQGEQQRTSFGKPKKKLTPYALYMRENYMTLKKQCNDDKKAIFSMCHEMWEEETDEVKALYERRAMEEEEQGKNNDLSRRVLDDMEVLDSTDKTSSHHHHHGSVSDSIPRNMYMTNRSLNLESASQFASLVAAYHIDVSTRERSHIDVSQLLERSLVVPSRLEEI